MCIKAKLKARIVEKQYDTYKVKLASEIKEAKLKGKLLYAIGEKHEFPCVGDWVEVEVNDGMVLIEKILERKTKICRKSSGEATENQVIAANIDYVAIVLGLDGGRNYSDRLLERLMTIAWNSGATPLLILNKSDLNEEAELVKLQAETIAPGVDIIISSAKEETSTAEILNYLTKGKVGVFIGPSGVGKSSLTNLLLRKEVQQTNEIRKNDKRGRHTTSTSYMFELENGAYVIDSPGIREVQAWAEEEDLEDVFSEIANIAQNCRYKDCQHQGESGCAVQTELERGYITPERYDSYLHLKKELAFLDRRKAGRNGFVERQYGKQFSKMVKQVTSKKRDFNNQYNK